MKDFCITTSSTCDLDKEYLKNNSVKYVPFNYHIDDELFKDNFYEGTNKKDFYEQLPLHNAKTSQPSPNDYYEMWKEIAKTGKDILHIELSSGISGGYNSALIARDMIKDEYKDLEVEVVDSKCASSGLGLLVQLAVENKNDTDLIKLKDYIENIKLNIRHIFFSDDLTQFFKGGRISKTSFTIGKFLNIVPIMDVDKDGKLRVITKGRGFSNAINTVVKNIEENINEKDEYKERFLISNSDCIELAEKTFNAIKEVFKNANYKKSKIYDIGTVIGTHTGKGTVAVFYIGNKRDN